MATMGSRRVSFLAVVALAGLSLVLAALIILGEVLDNYALGGGALGAILVAYGVIGLFLRKLGITGPRGAERS
ncbi:MAG: hypothetical protein HY334_07080 [Armatimonadetes bacterium]|nr:hypothetical protein [Armatimonadota bacterium]